MAVAHTFLTPASLSLFRGASCWLFRFLTQTRREPFYLFFFFPFTHRKLLHYDVISCYAIISLQMHMLGNFSVGKYECHCR